MRRHGWLALAWVLAGATITAAQEKPALPDGTVARLGMPRLRVSGRIFDTAFSPDGRTFVILSHGKKEEQSNVVLFDVATGVELKRLDIRDPRNVAMARHKPLMVVDANKGFEVWDLATAKLVKQWPYPAAGWSTTALAISPDGTEVVAAVSQRDKAVILRWDAATGKVLPARYPTTSQICALCFSADGSKLLTASEDTVGMVEEKITTIPGRVITWDSKTGMKLAELGDLSRNVAFSADGSRFARGMTGKSVEIIDIGTGKRLAEFAEPHAQFAFTPDSKRLVIGSGGAIRLWDIDANNEAVPLEGKPRALSVRPRFSADGRLLAVTQYDASANYVQFWDVATGKQIRFATGHPGAIDGLAYSPDGRQLATFSEDTLLIFDPKTGEVLHRWVGHKASINQIAFSPDGKLLASASFDGTIGLWDPATAMERRRLTAKDSVRSLAFTRDGATLIAPSNNRSVQRWDVEKGVLQHSYEVPLTMAAPSISPTGQFLACFAVEGRYRQLGTTLHCMNARTGKRLPSINLKRDQTTEDDEFGGGATPLAFAFLADSKLLATSDSLRMSDHAVRVWETATGQEILRFAGIPNSTRLLAISPDGRMLAHGVDTTFRWGGHGTDETVILRDISSGQSVSLTGKADCPQLRPDALQKRYRPIGGHHGSITCLAFSPDSKFIATGGSDQVVYVWRVEDFFKRPIWPEVKGDVAALWPLLADANAGKAYQAIAQLERKPKETVALLRKHLQPVPTADEKVIAQHLRDLSSDNFAVRQQAHVALEKTGEQAAHLLQEALRNPSNLEVKRRLETLMEKLERPLEESGQVRVYRGLVLLERIGTPEARKLLMELSQGAPAAWLTTEARYSLKRSQGR
jgi:WD40 repeat protein